MDSDGDGSDFLFPSDEEDNDQGNTDGVEYFNNNLSKLNEQTEPMLTGEVAHCIKILREQGISCLVV